MGVSDGGNWGFRHEFPALETGVGNRGWKQGLETRVAVVGNSSCRRWKLGLEAFYRFFGLGFPTVETRVADGGNSSFRRWKLGFQTGVSNGGNWGWKQGLETGVSDGGNWGWKLGIMYYLTFNLKIHEPPRWHGQLH